MSYVVFKNKNIKYRKEDFGGLVLIENSLYILIEEEYNLIKKIDSKKYFYEDELNEKEKNIVKRLNQKNILLKIPSKKAEEILEEQKPL